MHILTAWLAGLVFGFGLLVSGMSNPAKVLAFLDLAGPWDPSLTLVMAGAIGTSLTGYLWAKQRQLSLLGLLMSLPKSTQIDRRLVLGNLTFGVGWGLAGYCPGPALVSLGAWGTATHSSALIFVASMLVGMGLFEWMQKRS
jgi:uncharacterized membrane protein YedE/YeeE